MKVHSDSPSQTKSPGNLKKRKDEMINNLLAMTMAHIKVKKEPMSEEDSADKVSRKPVKTPKKGIESNRDEKQTSESPKKKRSKPHNHDLNISRGEPVVKKIKVEKVSEDERHDSSPRKVKPPNREFHSSVRIKEEKEHNNFMKERDFLEKLFSEPATPNKKIISTKDLHKYPREDLKVGKSKNSMLNTKLGNDTLRNKPGSSYRNEAAARSNILTSNVLDKSKLQVSYSSKSRPEVLKSKQSSPKNSVIKGIELPQQVQVKVEKTHADTSSSESKSTSQQLLAGETNMGSKNSKEHSFNLQGRSVDTSESSSSESGKATSNRRKRLKSEKSPRVIRKLISGSIGGSFGHNLSDSDINGFMENQRAADSSVTQSPSIRRHSLTLGTGQLQERIDVGNKCSENSSESSGDENVSKKQPSIFENDRSTSTSSSDETESLVKTKQSKIGTTNLSNLKQKKKHVSVHAQPESDAENEKLEQNQLTSRHITTVNNNSDETSSSRKVPSARTGQVKVQKIKLSNSKETKTPVLMSVPVKSGKYSSIEDSDNDSVREESDRLLPAVDINSDASRSSNEEVPNPKTKQMKLQKNSDLKNNSEQSLKSKVAHMLFSNPVARSSESGSSSDERVPLAKPVNNERSKTQKEKRFSVLSLQKTDMKMVASDTNSSSVDDSSPTAHQLKQKKNERVLPAVKSDTESSSDSDEEVLRPELQNNPNKRNTVSTRSSKDKLPMSTYMQHNNSVIRNSEVESSSDEDGPLPMPIKSERMERPKASDKKKRLSVPLPIKTDRNMSDSDDSSSSEGDMSSRAVKLRPKSDEKTLPAVDRGLESSTSSDEETPVLPKIQNKENRRISGFTSNAQDKSPKSKIKATQQNNSAVKDSDMESSSDENVSLPKPIKHERNYRSKVSDKKERLSVPLPIKTDRKTSDSESNSSSEDGTSSKAPQLTRRVNEKALLAVDRGSESSTSSEETPARPLKLHNKENRRISSSTRSSEDKSPRSKIKPTQQNNSVVRNSNVESSSDEDESLPKPIKRSKASDKKERLSVPFPIKTDRKTSVSESTSSSEEDNSGTTHQLTQKVNEKDPSIRRQSHSDSSSEADVPPPKKMKIENNRSAKSRGNVQVPPPISLKREGPSYGDDSSSSDQEQAAKEVSQNSSKYSAMNWTEKIKHRFPGIEKQSIKLRLPEERGTKYSLLLVPKQLDPRNLLKLKCNLNKNTVVNLNNKEYIFELLPRKPDPVVANVDKPRLVKLHSVISLQQFVPELKLKELVAPKRENLSLPSEIKVRHPLFGANYKEKISLDKNVKRKLQEAIHHKRKLEKKEKRRRKSKKKSPHIQSVEKSILDIFNSITPTRNINDIDLIPVKKEDSGSELNSSKSKRKIKHNREHSSTPDDEVLHSTQKKHKRKKKYIVSSIMETSGNSFSDDGHKKKKKRKAEIRLKIA